MTNIIPVTPKKVLNIDVNSIKVQSIGVAPNGSGNWTISFALGTSLPSISAVSGMSINQSYNANGAVLVTRDEILTTLAIPLSTSILDVTLRDIENAVTQVALDKLNTTFGW